MKLAAILFFALGGMMLIIRANARLRPRFWPEGVGRTRLFLARVAGLAGLAAAVLTAIPVHGVAIGLVLSLTMILVTAPLAAFAMNLYRPHAHVAPVLLALGAAMAWLP
jgi:hypothetical protein